MSLELLAESIDAEKPERAALDLFDRLRLREPLAHSFLALGFKGEESWRATARIKVALLVEAGVFAPEAFSMGQPERAETVPIDGIEASATTPNATPAKAPAEQKTNYPTSLSYPVARRGCPLANRRTRGKRAYVFRQGVL